MTNETKARGASDARALADVQLGRVNTATDSKNNLLLQSFRRYVVSAELLVTPCFSEKKVRHE